MIDPLLIFWGLGLYFQCMREACSSFTTVIFQQIVCKPTKLKSYLLSSQVKCIRGDCIRISCRTFFGMMTTGSWSDLQTSVGDVRFFIPSFRDNETFSNSFSLSSSNPGAKYRRSQSRSARMKASCVRIIGTGAHRFFTKGKEVHQLEGKLTLCRHRHAPHGEEVQLFRFAKPIK